MRLAVLMNINRANFIPSRLYNCWTAAITKKHRKVYERTYPTILVFSNGSTINIAHHIPRKIILLPHDLSTLSEAERKVILERRKPRTKIVIEEEVEDEDFDTSKYVNMNRR